MRPRCGTIRRCPTCGGLVAERAEPLSQRDDYVRCPWCAALFWFKNTGLVVDVADRESSDDASPVALFSRTRVAQAATTRDVFDALFPPFRDNFRRESSESWLQRARELVAEVLKTIRR